LDRLAKTALRQGTGLRGARTLKRPDKFFSIRQLADAYSFEPDRLQTGGMNFIFVLF